MSATEENPLLSQWDGTFAAPPFSKIRAEHFRPAFEAALAERRAEIAAIKADSAAADFSNTILALERAGQKLDRVSRAFFHLAHADSNPKLEDIELEIAPVLARERNAILLDDELFARVDQVFARSLSLDAEARRLVERYRLAFVRSGAGLDAERKKRLAEIAERLASLGAAFGQNVLADEREYLLLLESSEDLAGLPKEFLDAAARTAKDRGYEGRYGVTLSRSSVEPFLQLSSAPRLAGKSLARVCGAGPQWRRSRQSRPHGRDAKASRREGGAARLPNVCRLSSRRHDGEDARGRARSDAQGLGPGAPTRAR